MIEGDLDEATRQWVLKTVQEITYTPTASQVDLIMRTFGWTTPQLPATNQVADAA